ncbi:MAG: hypothetical protein ACREID_07540 [Planctomycetota bacterium]
MKTAVQIVVLLGAGAGIGAFLVHSEGGPGGRARSGDARLQEARHDSLAKDARIAALEAEIERLKALLAQHEGAAPGEEAAPADTPEQLERLLEEAYGDNNVDWLLDVIRRLLRMGERGYPILRRMIEDIVFKAKFLPSGGDFRFDQLYKLGRIGLEEEKHIIGFIDFLLTDAGTLPIFRQFAMMAAAYYVGSKAPGTEKLQETLMQSFLAQSGANLPAGAAAEMGKRMQLFAMAMSGDPKMIAPLHDQLASTDDRKLQGDIIGALAYLGDPSILPLIKDRLDPTAGDFGREIDALGRLGTEQAHAMAAEFLTAIPDSKRFYQHARRYMRAGGGTSAIAMIKERVATDPDDPEVGSTIGALRRFPTKESRDTLILIRDGARNAEVKKRASEAADEVDRKLRGEIPAELRPGG